jgi:hypothetical protein
MHRTVHYTHHTDTRITLHTAGTERWAFDGLEALAKLLSIKRDGVGLQEVYY